MDDQHGKEKDKEYQSFAIKRGIVAVVLVVALVWGLAVGLGHLDKSRPGAKPEPQSSSEGEHRTTAENAGTTRTAQPAVQEPAAQGQALMEAPAEPPDGHDSPAAQTAVPQDQSDEAMGHQAEAQPQEKDGGQVHAAAAEVTSKQAPSTASEPKPAKKATAAHEAADSPDGEQPSPATHVNLPTGMTFVNAVMEPIEYELKKRFWGWRPNDLANVTDNVNNFQLGVLEVTRRSVVQLAERISRTGSTDSFNPHLENAMNWLMVKATRYWFPSPEAKYKESLEELTIYRDLLMKNKASFYTRTDNLIPLLSAYEDLLGSCDENLVRYREEDGTKVSFFKADDYFYYAKGVASAMATILEAIHHDFAQTLEGRRASELLHHAIQSCKRAAALSPWIIMDRGLDSIMANHRANMAAPISHAKFYLGQLGKTLST
ncbi:MAG: DUF2333 family protein [Desulfosarcinaceae bacterium]